MSHRALQRAVKCSRWLHCQDFKGISDLLLLLVASLCNLRLATCNVFPGKLDFFFFFKGSGGVVLVGISISSFGVNMNASNNVWVIN